MANAGEAIGNSPFCGWSAEDFLKRDFAPKEPLITNLVHRRDLIALGARRRHGKTSFTTDIGVALAVPEPQFLGYEIPKPRRSLTFSQIWLCWDRRQAAPARRIQPRLPLCLCRRPGWLRSR